MLLSEVDSPTSLEQSLLHDPEFDLGFYFDDEDQDEDEEIVRAELLSAASNNSSRDSRGIDNLSEQLEASLEDMIQTAQMHPRSLQVSQNSLCWSLLFVVVRRPPAKVIAFRP